MKKSLVLIGLAATLNPATSFAQGSSAETVPVDQFDTSPSSILNGTIAVQAVSNARAYYFVPKHKRGSTIAIRESVISNLCGDFDGCQVRIGMFDWDGTGRMDSNEFLFFYNRTNKNWRGSFDHEPGQNQNTTTEHPAKYSACYFTDGKFENWVNKNDISADFGLMSWRQYNAGCMLTIID